MDWVKNFYVTQGKLGKIYSDEILDYHKEKATIIDKHAGNSLDIIELGAGGFEIAAATALMGHKVIAVELVSRGVENAKRLIEKHELKNLEAIQGDFYQIQLNQNFDVICYWDGFGIGEDKDQRKLLKRIKNWLKPKGIALIDIYTPWYASYSAKKGWKVGDAERQYDFDAKNCCWLDKWWPIGKEEESVTQILRCYSPADLKLLLEGTGLKLEKIEAGGSYNIETKEYKDKAPLDKAISYLAILTHS